MSELLARNVIGLMERGLVPDALIRRGIRHLCAERLATLARQSAEVLEIAEADFVAACNQSAIACRPEKANEQHYEVPAEFFRHVLGGRRKYSCCLWGAQVSTLEEAEEAALAETCQHAELEDGQEVLDLGCGWGALTLWIAEHYPRCRVTAVSNSHSQRQFIEQRLREIQAQDRVTVVTADINEFRLARPVDRVISVEMFEHVRNHRELLSRIRDWLRPNGKLLVHVFCHRTNSYLFDTEGASNWMGRYFFTGGMMPSESLFDHYHEIMRVDRRWQWNGLHYQRTAEAWLENFDRRRAPLRDILTATYGPIESRRWMRRWRIFFLAVAELFGHHAGEEWFVSHSLLVR